MRSLNTFFKYVVVGILFLTLEALLSTGAMGQGSRQRAIPDTVRIGLPVLDPLGDIIQEPDRISSTKKLSKVSAFTDGTIRGYQSSLDSGNWVTTGKEVRVYESNRLMKTASISPATPSKAAATVSLTLYSYFANGLTKEMFQPNYGRTTYEYNDSGHVTMSLSTYFIASGTEVAQSRSTYTYDSGTVLSQILYETYTNSTWSNSTRTTYFSDSLGVQDSALIESWQNGWALTRKSLYFYDAMNRSTTSVICYPNAITGVMQPQSRTISVTDSFGKMIQWETDNYSQSTNTWTPGYRISFTYDSEGYTQVQLYSFWDSYSMTWNQYYKYEYSKYPSPSVTLITPNEGDNYPPNSPLRIRWLASGLSFVDLSCSTDNGLSWNSIATNIPDTGYSFYDWTALPAEYSQCKTKISASDNSSVQHIVEGTFSTFNILTNVDHTTNTVRMSVLNNGYVGADPNGNGSGFAYKSAPNALFSGGVFIGSGTGQGKGMIGSFGFADFQNSQPLRPLTSSMKFDQVGSTTIREIYNTYSSEIGIRSQSRMSDDFVFVSYVLRNNGYSSWPDMYIGVFADWDVGNPFSNFGGIDSARGLAYQYESGQTPADSNYYGIIAFNRFSGATIMTEAPSSGTLITSIQSIRRPSVVGDNRMFIGSGPYAINPGDSAMIDFAFVAGANLADLKAHADSASNFWRTVFLTAASFDASASSLNFGPVSVGHTHKDSVTVTNHGTRTLNITAVTSTNPCFTVTPTTASVAIETKQKFYIMFAPSAAGQQEGKIAFTHNALTRDTITVLGNGVVGGVEISDGGIPKVYELRGNYPNPFNPSTTILYGLPIRSKVELKVYSLLGQEVATLFDGVQDAGYHRVAWNGLHSFGSQVASGVYFFRITARSVEKERGAFTQVKKMLLLR